MIFEQLLQINQTEPCKIVYYSDYLKTEMSPFMMVGLSLVELFIIIFFAFVFIKLMNRRGDE